MPILEYRIQTYPPCSCCGEITDSTTGIVEIDLDPAPFYVARWNPHPADKGIALLIGLGDPRGFVAARYNLESNGLSIIGPDDYNWHSSSIQILERSQVINTPLAANAFRVIDEIWMHDPEIRAFIEASKGANHRGQLTSDLCAAGDRTPFPIDPLMPMNVTIRPERGEDIEVILRIIEEAFRGHPYSSHTEQFIVAELRRRGALFLSLVAAWDSTVVGHIAFSPVEISDGSPGWYGLGPVAVAPDFQGRGIGQALVRTGLAALESSDAQGCVVLGEPEFYGRFGFRNHPDCMLEGVPPEYFQILSFGGHLASGKVSYHPAFSAGS